MSTERDEVPPQVENNTAVESPAAPAAESAAAPAAPRRRSDDAHKIYIRDISANATESDLRAIFSRAGDIVDIFVRRMKDKPLQYAFVGFSNNDEVECALKLDGQEVDGSAIHVERKNIKEKVCHKCNKPGHIAVNCRESDKVCYNCNRKGHVSRDCPDARRTGGGDVSRGRDRERKDRDDDRGRRRDRSESRSRSRSKERRSRHRHERSDSRDRRRRRRSTSSASSDSDRSRSRTRRSRDDKKSTSAKRHESSRDDKQKKRL